MGRVLFLAVLYFATHLGALDRTPAWDYDDGGLMNPAVHFAERGELRYSLYHRTPDDQPRRLAIYGPVHFVPLGWWLRFVGISGVNARLFSVLLTFATLWVLAELARSIAGFPAWLVTVLLLNSSLQFHAVARSVRPDASQVLWQCVALAVTVHAWKRSPATGWWGLAGLAAAMCTLSHFLGFWVFAVVLTYLGVAHWGRWHRAPAFVVGVAGLVVPLLCYVWWLGTDDLAVTFFEVSKYVDVPVTDGESPSIVARLTANVVRDVTERLPGLERGGIGFWRRWPSANSVWWHRSWLVVGAGVPLVLWPLTWLKPGAKGRAAPLGLLSLAAWGGVVFHLAVYPNKSTVYLAGAAAFLYCGAGVALGLAWRFYGKRTWGRVLAVLWLLTAVGINAEWPRYYLFGTRHLTAYETFGRALDALTPPNLEVFGEGRWWPWLRSRPFTAYVLFLQPDRPPGERDRFERAAWCRSPTQLESSFRDVPRHLVDEELDRLRMLLDPPSDRPLLGTVAGFPYGMFHIYGPRLTARDPRPPEPVDLAFHEGRCYRLRALPSAKPLPVQWHFAARAPGDHWELAGPAHPDGGTLWLAPNAGEGASRSLFATLPVGPRARAAIRVHLEVRGAFVRYGYLPADQWSDLLVANLLIADPHVDLQPSRFLTYTVVALDWTDPEFTRPFCLGVYTGDIDDSPERAYVRILSAEYLLADEIDLTGTTSGSLLEPAWQVSSAALDSFSGPQP